MNWEAIAAVAEFAGAIAVIITLIYLSYQLRQSNQIAKAEAIRELTNTYDLHFAHLHFPDLNELVRRGLDDFHALSAEEQARFNGSHYPLLNHVETVHEMRDLKLVSDHQHDSWMAAVIGIIVKPGGHQWWTHARTTMSPVFVEAIEDLLEDDSYTKVPFTTLWPWTKSERNDAIQNESL